MDFRPEIIFEDNHLLAVNKPPGILSQGDRTGDPSMRDLMMDFIKVRDKKPGNVYLHPVHRLDRPVSGCLILAKTSKSLSRMTILFKEGKVSKSYTAICTRLNGARDFGHTTRVTGYIKKDTRKNVVLHSFKESANGKKATTDIERLMQLPPYHVFRCSPLTGRPHQIRIQLSAIGYPIVGDVKYQGQKADPRSIYLHSFEARFVHPVRKDEISIKAPLPDNGLWQELAVSSVL